MKKKILALEDELGNQRILDIILGREYQLVIVENGQEAFEWLRTNDCPDLIITDWKMPIMDGRTFLNELYLAPQYAHIPVIILSSCTNLKDELSTIAFKTREQLAKPVTPQCLRMAINRVLQPVA
jgi:CheY-like chemotaxis protein